MIYELNWFKYVHWRALRSIIIGDHHGIEENIDLALSKAGYTFNSLEVLVRIQPMFIQC